MKDFLSLQHLLECPECHKGKPLITENSDYLTCEYCDSRYLISHGRPVLLRLENTIFSQNNYHNISKPTPEKSIKSWIRFFQSPSVNLSRKRVLTKLNQSLKQLKSATVLVVGGGGDSDYG